MNKTFNFTELSSNVINFLKNYSPKNDMYTSTKEMKEIISKLGLDETSDIEYIRSIRNSVVELYSNLEKNEIIYDENGKFAGRTEKFWKYNDGMMSVTAVIDNVMYNINHEAV